MDIKAIKDVFTYELCKANFLYKTAKKKESQTQGIDSVNFKTALKENV